MALGLPLMSIHQAAAAAPNRDHGRRLACTAWSTKARPCGDGTACTAHSSSMAAWKVQQGLRQQQQRQIAAQGWQMIKGAKQGGGLQEQEWWWCRRQRQERWLQQGMKGEAHQ